MEPRHWASPSNEIHVWIAVADELRGQLGKLAECLSSEECQRANRYAFDKDRESFIIGRSLLRQLLGSALGLPPTQVTFLFNGHGKPFLPDTDKQFNVSHSGGVIAVACAVDSVGVDVEAIRQISDMRKLANRYFSADELLELAGCSDEDLPEQFFACWTKKEAYIKGVGLGLSLPLDEFSVPIPTNDQWLPVEKDGGDTWYVQTMPLDVRGVVGALAATSFSAVHIHRWSPDPN